MLERTKEEEKEKKKMKKKISQSVGEWKICGFQVINIFNLTANYIQILGNT